MTVSSAAMSAIRPHHIWKFCQPENRRPEAEDLCIAFLTGNSFKSTYYELQQGVTFTQYHYTQIDEANKILSDLSIPIAIDRNTQY